jgi:hypothetical protein
MQFYASSYYFTLLGPNILLNILFYNTFTSLRVREEVSHMYKAAGKIILVYISFIRLFDKKTGSSIIVQNIGY